MTQEEQAALVEGQQQAPAQTKTDNKAEAENVEQTDKDQQTQHAASGAQQQITKIWSDLFRIKSFRRSKATGSSPTERALRASKAAAKASAKAAKFAELAKAAADDASRIAAEISLLAIETAAGDSNKIEDAKPAVEETPKQEEVAAK